LRKPTAASKQRNGGRLPSIVCRQPRPVPVRIRGFVRIDAAAMKPTITGNEKSTGFPALFNTPGWTRTSDPGIRNPMLYPTELRAQRGFRGPLGCLLANLLASGSETPQRILPCRTAKADMDRVARPRSTYQPCPVRVYEPGHSPETTPRSDACPASGRRSDARATSQHPTRAVRRSQVGRDCRPRSPRAIL